MQTAIQQVSVGLAKRFSVFECDRFAEALIDALKARGFSGQLVRLSALGPSRGFLVTTDPSRRLPSAASPGSAISANGNHYGVRVDGLIYCLIFPEGLRADQWQSSFTCDTGRVTVAVWREFDGS